MKRTPEIAAAAIFLVLAALASLGMTIYELNSPEAAAQIEAATANMPANAPNIDQIMQTARAVGIGMQAAGLVFSGLAAFGLWKLTKWGFWLGLILSVLKVLSSLPMFFTKTMPVTPLAFGELAVGLIVLIFLLLRDTRAVIFPEKR